MSGWSERVAEFQKGAAKPVKQKRDRDRTRKSPGHPDCEKCKKARRGACKEHVDYYAPVDVKATVVGSGSGYNPEQHWKPWP